MGAGSINLAHRSIYVPYWDMRFTPEDLTYKALLVVCEAVHACSSGPVKLSLGLRLALAYLCTTSRVNDVGLFKAFAACIADPLPGQTAYMANYMRALQARGLLNALMEGAGFAATLENHTKLRKDVEKLTGQPMPDTTSRDRVT